jgi:hypothetical protein
MSECTASMPALEPPNANQAKTIEQVPAQHPNGYRTYESILNYGE